MCMSCQSGGLLLLLRRGEIVVKRRTAALRPPWLAAGVLYLLVGLFQNGGIVFERFDAVARVHVVEVVRWVQPRRFDVVDGEFYIWRHPRWLDRAEVDAFNGGAGVGFAH